MGDVTVVLVGTEILVLPPLLGPVLALDLLPFYFHGAVTPSTLFLLLPPVRLVLVGFEVVQLVSVVLVGALLTIQASSAEATPFPLFLVVGSGSASVTASFFVPVFLFEEVEFLLGVLEPAVQAPVAVGSVVTLAPASVSRPADRSGLVSVVTSVPGLVILEPGFPG